MKRPLFAFCLFVILVLTILTMFGAFSTERYQALLPEDKSIITITGTTCKIDSDNLYINHINGGTSLPSHFSFSIPLTECPSPPAIGNTIQITAKFKGYSHATNPGEFDAYDYYSSQNVYGTLSNVKISILSNHINPVKHYLYLIRNAGIQALKSTYDSVEATILGDLLFGDKTGLDPDIKELYQRVGISHILSISGLHISIIGLGLFKLLRTLRCPMKASAIIGAVVLILFGFMTGMSTSAIRAIGIYTIGVLSKVLGRTTDQLTSLSLVATIILLLNPTWLTSCSFLLSFGSVLGICCLYPSIKEIIGSLWQPCVRYHPDTPLYRFKAKIIKLFYALLDSLLAGLSITLTTLPIQLYFFYEIPLYSSLLNLLIIPMMSILIICGYISVFFPFLYVPNKICSLILSLYEFFAKLFEAIPNSHWNPGRPASPLIVIYYLLWLFIVLYPKLRPYIERIIKHKQILYLSTGAIFISLIIGFNQCMLPTNSIIFLNVGQGDCILVYTDSRDVLLFDGGSANRSKVGQYVIKSSLKYYGLSHISAIYVSHTDSDHTNGIDELLQNSKKWGLKIDNLYMSKQTYSSYSDRLPSNSTQIQLIASGYRNKYGSVQLTCLHPDDDYIVDDTNSASLCILLDFTNSLIPSFASDMQKPHSTKLLLCGDVCDSGEELLTDAILPYSPITLLKVSHHGSKYSTTDNFLYRAQPSLAFISAGQNNSYGHPHRETLDRLTNHNCLYYTTIDYGAITVTVKQRKITIKKAVGN